MDGFHIENVGKVSIKHDAIKIRPQESNYSSRFIFIIRVEISDLDLLSTQKIENHVVDEAQFHVCSYFEYLIYILSPFFLLCLYVTRRVE